MAGISGLYYPTLDLFYYYAKEGLGIKEAEVKYFDTYWKSLQKKYNSSENPIYFTEKELDGQFRRQNLGDSDGFYFGCSLDEQTKPHPPAVVTKLKERIEKEIIAPPPESNIYLGSTWMIYGWVDSDKDDIKLAGDFYKQLVGEEWQHQREGKILGATVIEAWRSHQEWDVPETGSHVIIILYPNEETYAKAATDLISFGWIPLLLYRHKVWYSYQKSRRNKEKIRNTFNKAIADLKDHETYSLDQLGKALERNRQSLNDYSIDLNAISIHQHSLDTNLDNYNLLVKQFTNIAKNINKLNFFRADDLKFLEEFNTIATVKYERQLEKDYANLAPGLAVLTGLTETIRGLVEVQQAEIDRQQNITLAILGLGLSATGAVAGIVGTQVIQPNNPQSGPWSLVQGFWYSLIPTIIISVPLLLLALLNTAKKIWYQNRRKRSS